jgi:hypothetical protein
MIKKRIRIFGIIEKVTIKIDRKLILVFFQKYGSNA